MRTMIVSMEVIVPEINTVAGKREQTSMEVCTTVIESLGRLVPTGLEITAIKCKPKSERVTIETI